MTEDLLEMSEVLGHLLEPLLLGRPDRDALWCWARLRFLVSSALEGEPSADLETLAGVVAHLGALIRDQDGP